MNFTGTLEIRGEMHEVTGYYSGTVSRGGFTEITGSFDSPVRIAFGEKGHLTIEGTRFMFMATKGNMLGSVVEFGNCAS
ncbi:MAG: hypothetical protein QM703_13640 [Gemmatales bacterium]